jgi:nucleoside-diphosphate-sugar epimerase
VKLLLTGATGFVGRNLILRALAEQRYETIYVPVRSRKKLEAQWAAEGYGTLPPELVPIEASAEDWNLGEAAQADHVVHGAGTLSGQNLDEYLSTNVEGTLRLLRALPKSARVVILSSQAAAGPCLGELEKSESSPEIPVTWYGKSKLEMERRVMAEFGDRKCVILRPPMVLGPRDTATLALFKMAKGVVQFKPGFRSKWYSFIAVDDLVSAIFSAFANEAAWSGGVRKFFVTSGKPFSDRDLIHGATRALQRPGRLLSIPQAVIWLVSRIVNAVPAWRRAIPNLTTDRAREIWPDRWVVSSRAFEQEFGFRPQGDLVDVLAQTCRWYERTGELPK